MPCGCGNGQDHAIAQLAQREGEDEPSELIETLEAAGRSLEQILALTNPRVAFDPDCMRWLSLIERSARIGMDRVEVAIELAQGRPGFGPDMRARTEGEVEVYAPDVCGAFAWAQLHSWANNIREWICPTCGEFAVKMARAMHDLVNLKLGKPLRTPEEFNYIASLFAQAAQGQPLAAAGHARLHAEASAHLRKDAQLVDMSQGHPPHEVVKDPSLFEAFRLDVQDDMQHYEVYGCPAGKFDRERMDCQVAGQLVSIIHPPSEEGVLEKEALKQGVPVSADGATQEASPSAIMAFIQGVIG